MVEEERLSRLALSLSDVASERSTSVILLAGGKGTRFSKEEPKLTAKIEGQPLLAMAARTIVTLGFVRQLVLVVRTELQHEITQVVNQLEPLMQPANVTYAVCEGGATRSESVQAGLNEVMNKYVLIHDGSRPLASRALFERVIAQVEPGIGVVPTLRPADSLLTADGEGHVLGYLQRIEVRLAQTPQGFITSEYRAAREALGDKALSYSDDGSVFLAAGYEMLTISGEEANLKITHANHLIVAQQLFHETRRDS